MTDSPIFSLPFREPFTPPDVVSIFGDLLVLRPRELSEVLVYDLHTGSLKWRCLVDHIFTAIRCGDVLVLQELTMGTRNLRAMGLDLGTGDTIWSITGTRQMQGERATASHVYHNVGPNEARRLDARTGKFEKLPDTWVRFDVDDDGRIYGSRSRGGEVQSEPGPTGVHLEAPHGVLKVRGGHIASGNFSTSPCRTTSLATRITREHEFLPDSEWVFASGAIIAHQHSMDAHRAIAFDPETRVELWRRDLVDCCSVYEHRRWLGLSMIGIACARTGDVVFEHSGEVGVEYVDDRYLVVEDGENTKVFKMPEIRS